MSYSQALVTLARRHQGMPTVYKVENHPLVKGKEHVHDVYVGYMGTDKRSVKVSLDFEKTLKCPEGDITDWENQGTSVEFMKCRAPSHIILRAITAKARRLLLSERPRSV